MRVHVVAQGEHLRQLAFQYSFDATEVWNHPENAALKMARGTGDILRPGDLLYVPDTSPTPLTLEREGVNEYVVDVPRSALDLRFVLDDGTPIANEPYLVGGTGDDEQRTTDGDGHARFDAPVTARQVVVVFPRRYVSYVLLVGDLDPIETRSGIAARLANLGYYEDDIETADPRYGPAASAVAAFQQDQGIAATGEVDEATRTAISRVYGT